MAQQRPTWKSTAALVSLVLCALSWDLTAVMFGGRWLFGAGWFGPHREWIAFVVSAAFSIYHLCWGRPLLRKYYQHGDASQRTLTVGQSAAVIVMVVGFGAFATWFLCHRPG